MDDDINIIEYSLPDCFVVFIDLSDGRNPLRGCVELSLEDLIGFYLNDVHRDFLVCYISWNEIDPYFDRNDCLIFCNGVVL